MFCDSYIFRHFFLALPEAITTRLKLKEDDRMFISSSLPSPQTFFTELPRSFHCFSRKALGTVSLILFRDTSGAQAPNHKRYIHERETVGNAGRFPSLRRYPRACEDFFPHITKREQSFISVVVPLDCHAKDCAEHVRCQILDHSHVCFRGSGIEIR